MWVRRDKKKKGPGHWPEAKKLDVIQSYILLGSLRKAAALNNVPEITAKVWKATQFWRDTEDEFRRGSKLQLAGKLTELVNKSLAVIADRLEGGDFIYQPRTGTFVRKQISAEHANKIATQLIDRTLAVEKAAKPEKQTDEGLDARLQKLREEMIRFSKAKTIDSKFEEITTGELTNVTDEPLPIALPNPLPRSPEDGGNAPSPIGQELRLESHSS